MESETNYETWKNDVTMWCKLTGLPENKKALAIHLSLKGRARKASTELGSRILSADNGVEKLLEKLDTLFLPEQGRRQFMAFNNFYNLRRDSNTKVTDFVAEFEHMYYKFKSEKKQYFIH